MKIELVELEALSSDLSSRNIVIYGAGDWGRKTYEDLSPYLNIIAFSDSSEGKWGTYCMGKEIIAPQSITKECSVLITSVFFYREIEENLRKYQIAEKYIFGDYNHLLYKESFLLHHGETIDILSCIYGFDQAYMALMRDYENYQIVLYGEKETVKEACERLKFLGLTNLEIVTRNTLSEDGTIYSLMYEDEKRERAKKYVLLDRFSTDLISSIKQMGLELRRFQWSE